MFLSNTVVSKLFSFRTKAATDDVITSNTELMNSIPEEKIDQQQEKEQVQKHVHVYTGTLHHVHEHYIMYVYMNSVCTGTLHVHQQYIATFYFMKCFNFYCLVLIIRKFVHLLPRYQRCVIVNNY